MPRPLLIALVSVAWLPIALSQDVDAKRLPAVKRALDKAEATILRNRKAYDEANEKALAEAEKELLKEVDRLSKAGKPEEAIAVKTLATGFRDQAIASVDKKFAPANPAQAGAVAWNGHKYKYFPEALSWHEAKKKCEEMGGHLVIIDNQQEQEFVSRSLTAMPLVPKQVWLGVFFDAGRKQWMTVAGSPMPYARWGRNEPSGDGSHALLCLFRDGEWNDYTGNITEPVICEWDE